MNPPKKHIVMFSSGVASWCAAKRAAQKYGTKNLILLFADTLIEDEDNYRFLLEGAANIFGLPVNRKYIDHLEIPPLNQMELRKIRLWQIACESAAIRPYNVNPALKGGGYPTNQAGLQWIQDGRHVWEVLQQTKFLNDRAANCSKILKQQTCRGFNTWGLYLNRKAAKRRKLAPLFFKSGQYPYYLNWRVILSAKENLFYYHICESARPQDRPDFFNRPEEVTLYVGIDWSEYDDRMPKIKRGWYPYRVEAPLCWDDMGWSDRSDRFALLKKEGIEPPRLYNFGFPHANCSGGCIKAGKRQWLELLKYFPDVYEWNKEQEQQFQQLTGTNITVLLEQVKGQKRRISLQELSDRPLQLDLFQDWGGCGCFIS